MKRYMYDLSHYQLTAGKIGRLQTTGMIPVVAGDSFEITLEGVVRLSPLRRNLTMDAMVDLFAFYVPYRHVYGDDWKDFVLDGYDETVTFDQGPIETEPVPYLMYRGSSSPMPLWMTAGYNRIWNRYFRVPSDDSSIIADNTLLGDWLTEDGNWGKLCARPKTIWTTGVDETNKPTTTDREVNVSGGTFDIIDLAEVKARYRTEVDREWFGQRYDDILKSSFGGSANVDADERPTLIMRKTEWLSGYDVDGTADATLGTYAGKSASVVRMDLPRRFYPEHGTIWMMALIRFPMVSHQEAHYLTRQPQPTYETIAGDPEIIASKEPESLEIQDVFGGTSTTSLGLVPYAQHYRYHPSYAHAKYGALQGYPIYTENVTTQLEAFYHQDGDYDAVFSTEQLGHWQSQFRCKVDALRVIPPVLSSVYAGAK